MKNKLLLTLIGIATSLQIFAYSPFLDARYVPVDIAKLARMYEAMHADSSVLNPHTAVATEQLRQENSRPRVVTTKTSSDCFNSSPKSTNFNNFASHVAQPVTASSAKPIVVKQTTMIKKVVFPLAALGSLKLAYDSFKSQQASASEKQKVSEFSGNNFKMASVIGITISLFAYGSYKLYHSDIFAESKKATEQN